MANTVVQRPLAGLSKNIFLLAAASLFADISTEMLYPLLPVFLTQTLKASGSIVGLIDGAHRPRKISYRDSPEPCPTSCKGGNPSL